MPTYSYKCNKCGTESEDYREMKNRNWLTLCPRCKTGILERYMANERPVIFGDIPPYFDFSIGEHISGRRDKATKYRNAGMTPVAGHHGGDTVIPEKRLYGDEQYYDEVIKGSPRTDKEKMIDDHLEIGV